MKCEHFRQLERVLTSFDQAAAERAIYFDYEGIPAKSPVLLGWLADDQYQAAVIDPLFAECANRSRAREAKLVTHAAAAKRLIEKARFEDRHLVSWSWHDPKLLCAKLTRAEYSELRSRFVNAIRIARPWHHRFFTCVPPNKARMVYFACLLAIHIPPRYGDRVVAERLSALRLKLAANVRYGEFSRNERKKWVTVVKHNLWDLRTTKKIVVAIKADRRPAAGLSPKACALL